MFSSYQKTPMSLVPFIKLLFAFFSTFFCLTYPYLLFHSQHLWHISLWSPSCLDAVVLKPSALCAHLAGKHLTSPPLACLLHLTPDIPPPCRPLTPDPGLTTWETSLGYFPLSAALLFSSRPLVECRRVRQGERYPGALWEGGCAGVHASTPLKFKSHWVLSNQVTVKQCVPHPHPKAMVSPVLLLER